MGSIWDKKGTKLNTQKTFKRPFSYFSSDFLSKFFLSTRRSIYEIHFQGKGQQNGQKLSNQLQSKIAFAMETLVERGDRKLGLEERMPKEKKS